MAAAVRMFFPGGPGRAREGTRVPARPCPAPPGPGDAGRGRTGRDDSGETLAMLIMWPALLVAVLVLLVHTFIVVNAQSEAEVAASAGLRAAWRSSANEDFLSDIDPSTREYTEDLYTDPDPHPKVLEMAEAAQDAAARAAATDGGWRWWTPGATEVHSDWCSSDVGGTRPGQGQPGWVRVTVSGQVFGPLAALWPNHLDQVYAAAIGPAVLISPEVVDRQVPAELPLC